MIKLEKEKAEREEVRKFEMLKLDKEREAKVIEIDGKLAEAKIVEAAKVEGGARAAKPKLPAFNEIRDTLSDSRGSQTAKIGKKKHGLSV